MDSSAVLLLIQMCSIACTLPHVEGDSVCIAAKEFQGASIVPPPGLRQELCSAMTVQPHIACAETLLPTRVIPATSMAREELKHCCALHTSCWSERNVGTVITALCLRGLNCLLAGIATGCAKVH